jgi:hypothetical protein
MFPLPPPSNASAGRRRRYHRPSGQLLTLPDDCLSHALSFLPVLSAVRFSGTCKTVRSVAADPVRVDRLIASCHPDLEALLPQREGETLPSLYSAFVRVPAVESLELGDFRFAVRVDRETTTTGWFDVAAEMSGYLGMFNLVLPAVKAGALERGSLWALAGRNAGVERRLLKQTFGRVRVMVTDREGRSGLLADFGEAEWREGGSEFDTAAFEFTACEVKTLPRTISDTYTSADPDCDQFFEVQGAVHVADAAPEFSDEAGWRAAGGRPALVSICGTRWNGKGCGDSVPFETTWELLKSVAGGFCVVQPGYETGRGPYTCID